MKTKNRSLMDVSYDEILIWSDKVKEEGLAIVDPTKLLIHELAFPRWGRLKVLPAFAQVLPSFKAKVEGKPRGRYVEQARAGKRLYPYQCEFREVHLFEKASLEALLKFMGVLNLERHAYSPMWYVIPFPETGYGKPVKPENVMKVSVSAGMEKEAKGEYRIEMSPNGTWVYPYVDSSHKEKVQILMAQERIFIDDLIYLELDILGSQYINVNGEPE